MNEELGGLSRTVCGMQPYHMDLVLIGLINACPFIILVVPGPAALLRFFMPELEAAFRSFFWQG